LFNRLASRLRITPSNHPTTSLPAMAQLPAHSSVMSTPSAQQHSVLIVDAMEETREVLRSALESRGVRILEASEADEGLALARRHRPDLIVLDLEVSSAPEQNVSGDFEQTSRDHHTSLVLLGTARHHLPAADPESVGQFVAKPYHYAPLIRKIEALLAEARQPAA
jgi:two-component system cell cycle response regulator DivK